MPDVKPKAVGRILVPTSSLQPGWIVDRDIYHDATRLLAAGVTITPQILQTLKGRGIELIEVRADSALATGAPLDGSDALTALLGRSKQICEQHGVRQAIPEQQLEQAVDQIADFFGEIETGQRVNLAEVRETVIGLISQFLANSDLAVKLLDLDSFDRYTYRHSINVGLLFMMVARDWVNEHDLIELVFGAVLHDVGKAKVGAAIINKEGPLDDDEWAIIRKHTLWSAEMLAEAGAEQQAISIARWHHEKIDGSGYPDRLSGDQIDRYARLAAVCDVYDALTTRRSYKQKMDFARAIDIIIRGCGAHFDPGVAHEFIRRVGRYPAGTFVKLNTGETAVVLRANDASISRPVVSRVIDANGFERAEAEELDLSQDQSRHIVEILASHETA